MKRSVVIFAHIVFWVALIATRFIRPDLGNYLSGRELLHTLIFINLMPPIYFYIGYFFIMKIRDKRNFLILSIVGILVFYLVLFLISSKAFAIGIVILLSLLVWITIGSLVRILVDWFRKKNDLLVLERENVASNLASLKNQINPHFLFNTLHNIDALIYENQNNASKSLVKLSNIMRYMLNDAKSDFVELEKEIEHLKDYLSLEQLRLKVDEFLKFSISGNYNGLKIAPMILTPFVENAFKHSVDSSFKNGIIINISQENRKLTFVCENKFDITDTDKDKSHGIGLETVKKRLNLIYGNKHELSINSDNSLFKVNLEIELYED
jgi:two-component system, LytTR family, sensor kinase